MNDKDLESAIKEYLPTVIHMSLSTARDNKPWTSEVHYAYDDALHIYFRSKTSRRHSEDIAVNKYVSGNIVRQHGLGEKPRGIYFEGTAELLGNVTESDAAYLTYNERFSSGPGIVEESQQPDGHKFYKITVSDFYMFDAVESSPSQKYHLGWSNNG